MANVSNTNKKLKFGDNTENTLNTVLEVGSIDVTKLEKEWVNSISIENKTVINKPTPKYTKKEMLEVGDKKTVPNDWPYLIHTKKLGARGVVAASMYTPAANPGPCCMNDLYEHNTNSGVGVYGKKYIWDATAGGTTLPYGSTTPYVDGFFTFSQESGQIPSSKQYNPPVSDNYLEFEGFSIKWTGKSAGIPGRPGMQLHTNLQNNWAFPGRFTDGLLSGIGMQTQLDWSNSIIAYAYINPPFPSDIDYDSRYTANFTWAGEQINKPNTVPPYTINLPLFGRLPIAVPFCQGRALINSGSRQRNNPSYHSYTNTQYGITGELSNPEPRRMGWEGWIVRPHNVAWNWGNRGAFVDVLHYTLGYAEDESNAPNNMFINEWGVPQPWNGTPGAVLDSTGGILSPSPAQRRTCTQGYCSYPQPSLLMYSAGPLAGQYLMLGHPNASYNTPHIGYSQLEHQRNCCANSQWFQNARVLRNYSESTWNMIGSPWAGGMNKITIYDDQVWETVVTLSTVFTNPTTGLVGTNGNGPPEGESSDVKYSCTTFYTLNRILQYISSPSDFEEIFAKDYGNSTNGNSTTTPGFQELNPHPNQNGKRMWFPNQAGYYNENSNSNLTDDPWENMYRLRNVGLFYAMVNFCGDSSRDDITGGESGNLGNPPIAQLSGGQPTSQLTPGIWPWGHCISYACGNPEYSPNYDDSSTSSLMRTFNKLGERGCEAQTPWASMPLNYYYSNITFSGIKVFFFDESTGTETSKVLPQWSFSNSPEWSGEVPTTYEEASKSVIGFMMWLGHNSWDYSMTNSDGTIGRPAGNSGATGHGVGWWDPVDGDPQKGIPTLEGHYVFSLSNMSKKASTNGYYKGIRPNYTYLDVVEHLTRMHQQFPLFMETSIFDYENRPTGVPKYIGGVPIPTTDKTGNPPTGIPRIWHLDNNSEPNNNPDWGGNPPAAPMSWGCDVYPGEGWTSFGNVTSNPVGTQGPNSAAWGTFPTGDGVKSIGDPGGGNYCTQDVMTYNATITNASTPFRASWAHLYNTTSCGNWHMSMPCSPCSYKVNAYLNGCFAKGTIQNANSLGNTMGSVSWSPSTGGAGSPYKWIPGNIMGVSSVLGGPPYAAHPGGWRARCQCSRWYPQIQNHTAPQLVTGPHCEGCNVGCCTNEFNSVNTCEYVYPQGLFKSKQDCKRAYAWEPDTIPTSLVPAFIYSQTLQTPFGRRKTKTSPLGDTTFCKLRPAGVSGCMDSGALNYNPNATEDCSGSIAHTYTTIWNQAAGLWIPPQDNSCCIMAETGYKCDASQGGCHAVPGLWTVTTQAGSPGNSIYSNMNDCLAVWPTAASCAQEYLRRFVKACPCGDPYIAPQHEVNTHNQIMNGTLTPYDEDTYWGEFTAGTSSNPSAWDITKRRGRLWDTWNNPYSLNGGVIHGPISRSYTQQTWWRGDYSAAPAIGGNACMLTWSSFWQTTVIPLITYNDLGRINWGANGSNRWEKAPSSTVEYEDCCLSHAYAFPGSKMFAGWITIDGAIPEVGQSFRPMEHISSVAWQDGDLQYGDFDGASINGNIPYKISYVADWEPRYGPNSVVENKSHINKDIVGSFGMDSYAAGYVPNILFLNSVNPLSPWNHGTACNIAWETGGMGTSGNYDFTHVSCPNPSPAWSLWGQFGKTGGGGIAKQYPIPPHSTAPDGNCRRTCNSGNSNPCNNSKKWSEAKRLAPGTTDGKMPGYDFQGNWNGFDKNYYDHNEAPGSCWYHNTNLWTDRTEQCDWEPSNTKIQKLFAQPIHYAYHCGPPQWLWKGQQTCHDDDQGWPGFCLPPPPARNTGGVARQSQLNSAAIQKRLPWRTGAWSIAWGFGKWMYPWKLHGGQNDREGHQTFMACYDQVEQMNANLPRNI